MRANNPNIMSDEIMKALENGIIVDYNFGIS